MCVCVCACVCVYVCVCVCTIVEPINNHGNILRVTLPVVTHSPNHSDSVQLQTHGNQLWSVPGSAVPVWLQLL